MFNMTFIIKSIYGLTLSVLVGADNVNIRFVYTNNIVCFEKSHPVVFCESVPVKS